MGNGVEVSHDVEAEAMAVAQNKHAVEPVEAVYVPAAQARHAE